ncbi:hypothetical protein BC829DRAFT_360401 [Chytridium lagenaria]|nr:hypothetical protein BC829DRAFT_360401 [Chytridium lagenaria]
MEEMREDESEEDDEDEEEKQDDEDAGDGEEDEDEDEDEYDEDDEGDEEDEDEDEDPDEEPKLKYQRLAGTLGETLKKDAVSTMAVSDRFLALGTHWGIIHILDLNGNDVKRFECHSATVNEISIDTNGEYVASASDDGKIVINSLYSTETASYKHRRPMKSIALEPEYSRKTTRQFVCGGTGEELLLSGKGWFGSKDIVIHSGEGPVYTVRWRGNFIAWANEAGVKIYDITAQQKFAYIDRPPGSPRADLFRCNLCWKSDDTLFIGWADSVKVGVVKDRPKIDVASGLPARYVEIVCQFRTDFIVSGIAPLDNYIVLLSFMVDLDEHRNVDMLQPSSNSNQLVRSSPPEIHIVDFDGEFIANDVLSLFGYEHYRANDYRLEYLPAPNPAERTFYVVSPKDIVVAKPRDLDDHIEWLVERARYEEALQAAEGANTKGYTGRLSVTQVVEIGVKYLGSLVTEGKYELAAATTTKILRQDSRLWEEWIFTFAEANHLHEILPYIPTKDPALSSAVYEMVLGRFLESDKTRFKGLIKDWPHKLYNVKVVADAVGRHLKQYPDDRDLLESAIELYTADRRHGQALVCGLRLGDKTILSLVQSYNLFTTVETDLDLLFDYNARMMADIKHEDVDLKDYGWREGELLTPAVLNLRKDGVAEGLRLLVNNTDRIPVYLISSGLKARRNLHIYLDALFRKDRAEGMDYHSLQIALYAEFDHSRLLDFLRLSTAYKLEHAYEICENMDLVPEMVYLLGKMGNNRRALALVIERLGDVKQAIDFAKEQNDEGLWEDLLLYSMDKPPFIIGLLENLGAYIEPVNLIRRIPDGLEIPGLRDALVKVLTDYGIQMSLREGCQRILVNDAVELQESFYRIQRKGMRMSGNNIRICTDLTNCL